MAKPTLLVLAAGMASRYGSLKQVDGVGPFNEAIIDYSIYDAIRAGFGRVVFVIRHQFEEVFSKAFPKEKFGGKIDIDFAYQELDMVPSWFTIPEGRVKPWGTNHAVMAAKGIINEPFAVINSDDFYGRDAFSAIGEYLSQLDGCRDRYCMVGYCLKNTLSDFGTVSRGECSVDADGNLVSVVERLEISRQKDGTVTYVEDGKQVAIGEDTPVSMNMFGFTPDYFEHSDEMFADFLRSPQVQTNMKAEFFIPLVVNNLISSGRSSMRVLKSDAQWFGVTYKEDKPDVVRKIRALIDAGEYPEKLW